MPGTPTYGFRYPAGGDSPNVPLDISKLAVDVENKIITMDAIVAAAPIGGAYRAAALQSMATGLTKMNFGTAIDVANGITWNGSNEFTVLTTGVYEMSASCYMPGAGGFSSNVVIGDAAASLGTNYVSGVFTSGGLSSEASICRRLVAGSKISAYVYNNSATTNSLFSFDPAEFHVWKVA